MVLHITNKNLSNQNIFVGTGLEKLALKQLDKCILYYVIKFLAGLY